MHLLIPAHFPAPAWPDASRGAGHAPTGGQTSGGWMPAWPNTPTIHAHTGGSTGRDTLADGHRWIGGETTPW